MYQCNVRRYFICEESFFRLSMNNRVVFLSLYFLFFFSPVCFFFFVPSLEKVGGNDKCRRSVGMSQAFV